jgi:Peptidase MA superfamily
MTRFAAIARLWLVLALAIPGAMGMLAPNRIHAGALAATPHGARREPARWHVVETANFRILSYGTAPASAETAAACERQRERLARQWLSDVEPEAWSPKCSVVLHPTDESYLREVGGGGRTTVASSLVDRQAGRICLRRIDVRATRPDWQDAALGHELAHVVLADRFVDQELPRWIDEGMAILADSRDRRDRHKRALKRAIARGTQFRLAELLSLADYPPAERWETFYSQSASLVEYLVEQQGHRRFVEFAELAGAHGCEDALRRVYGVGIGELERRWRRRLAMPSNPAATAKAPNPHPGSSVSSLAG